jgi:hypothetical protein
MNLLNANSRLFWKEKTLRKVITSSKECREIRN